MDPIKYERRGKTLYVHPTHPMVAGWAFPEDEEKQAILANALAAVAEDTGVGVNELQRLFPAILRMLKDTSAWTK